MAFIGAVYPSRVGNPGKKSGEFPDTVPSDRNKGQQLYRNFTYKQLRRDVASVGSRLRSANLRDQTLASHRLGDRIDCSSISPVPGEKRMSLVIAIHLPRSYEFAVTAIAIHMIGATFLPLDVHGSLAHIRELIRKSGACIIVTSEALKFDLHRKGQPSGSRLDGVLVLDYLDLSRSYHTQKSGSSSTTGISSLEDLSVDEQLKLIQRASNTTAYHMYTSGSSGILVILLPHTRRY